MWKICQRGSPPRARGKGPQPRHDPRLMGITPACAGKSSVSDAPFAFARDHPRVCGEKSSWRSRSSSASGSPPRVRGKDNSGEMPEITVGITPACAGKRRRRPRPNRKCRDHPRVCGEKASLPIRSTSAPGSPPRVRGKDRHVGRRARAHGITPACAGKRTLTATNAPASSGSPPRVRGKDHPVCHMQNTFGITPACAGKSLQNDSTHCLTRDHPRVCGEKLIDDTRTRERLGSPPRVRGKDE